MAASILLILPCNSCVRMGDYSLCQNWRLILSTVGDLVDYGLVDLAAIDSCKPGIVPWGEERRLRWCDLLPSYMLYYKKEPWRLGILFDAVLRDLRELSVRYRWIVYYVNVKAYREVLDRARELLGTPPLVSAGPPDLSPLSFRSRRNREKLRKLLLDLRGLYTL